MKKTNKLIVAVCLALIACLAAPALMPAGLDAPFTGHAAAAINKTQATMYNGKTLKLKVTGTSKAVKWSSSNTAVAKVDQTGLVTAKKVGKTRITAKVGSKKLTCDVTVKSPLTASPSKLTMDVGQTKYVTLTYKLNGKLHLNNYDSSVLNCSLGKISRGKCILTIKALRAGTETLTVTNPRTKDVAKIKVTVRETKPTDSIVDRDKVTVAVGKTATVKVKWPYSGVPHVWCEDYTTVSCTWGEWNGSGWPLYIKGLSKGTAVVWFTRGDEPDEDILAEIKVTVK